MRTLKTLMVVGLLWAWCVVPAGCSDNGGGNQPTDTGTDILADGDSGTVDIEQDVVPVDLDVVTPPDEKDDADQFVPPPDADVADETTLDEVSQPDEIEQPEICLQSCQESAECEGVFEEVGPCQQVVCAVVPECTQDEDPANDKQCVLQDVDGCCEEDGDCVDDSVCTCNERCVDNACISDLCDPLPEECCQNNVVLSLDFENVALGQLPPQLVMPVNTPATDAVAWGAQEGPCGVGQMLYLGDPECRWYYNGSHIVEDGACKPVEEIACTPETEDDDCPPPNPTCQQNSDDTWTCKPEVAPKAVNVQLAAQEINLPNNALSSLTFRLWMDAEDADDIGEITFDRLKLRAEVVGEGVKQLWTSHVLDENTTGGACLLVAADLTDYAGKSINLIWDFNTADSNGNTFEGIYLDDIKVTTYCQSDLCESPAQCADDNACTVDSCVEFSNKSPGAVCDHSALPGCVPCEVADDCDGKGPMVEAPDCFFFACAASQTCEYTPDPSCCNPSELETYFADGFESGALPEGWEIETQANSSVAWQVVEDAGCPEADGDPDLDTLAIWFTDPATGTYDCGSDQCQGSFTTDVIDLSEVQTQMFTKLGFQLSLSTEWDGSAPEDYVAAGIDVLTVEALPQGEPAHEIWTSHGIFGTTHGQCLPMWADLTEFNGKKIQLRFTFDTGDVQPPANNFAGAIIDELRIETVCDAVCSVDADCAGLNECQQGLCIEGACLSEPIPECCLTLDDPACNDGDACTNDSCDVAGKTCIHEFNQNPSCCTPKESLFLDGFEDAATVDTLQATNGATTWSVPLDGECVINGFCDDETDSCQGCPGECGMCTTAWHHSTLDSASGDGALHFGNDQGTYEYQVDNVPTRAFGQMTTPHFVLPPYGIPVVSFMLKLDTEYCEQPDLYVEPGPFDHFRIYAQRADAVDDTQWTPPQLIWDSVEDWSVRGCTWDDQTDQVVWKPVQVGLDDSKYLGKAVRFVLEFDSLDAQNNAFGGVWVDDFNVSTVCDADYECSSPYECQEFTPTNEHCSIETCSQDHKCSYITNPMKPAGECCIQDNLASYDFDGPCGMETWEAQPPAGTVIWQALDGPCTDCGLYFGNADSKTYNAPGSPASGCVTSPEVDVTGKDQVEVTFNMYIDIEDPFYWLDFFDLTMDQVLFPGQAPIGSPVTIWRKPCDETWDAECMADPITEPTCLQWGCDTLEMQSCIQHTFTINVKPCGVGESWPDCYGWVPNFTPRLAAFQFCFDSGDASGNDGEGIYIDNFQVKSLCE